MDLEEAKKVLDDFFERYPEWRTRNNDDTVRFIGTLPIIERIPIQRALKYFADLGGFNLTSH